MSVSLAFWTTQWICLCPSCSQYTDWQTGCRGWLFRFYTLLSLLPCVSRAFVCRRHRRRGYRLPLRPIGTCSRSGTVGVRGHTESPTAFKDNGWFIRRIGCATVDVIRRFWLDVRFGINFLYYSACSGAEGCGGGGVTHSRLFGRIECRSCR